MFISKRILCEVDARMHADLKRRAALCNMTMKQYIINALIKRMLEEDERNNIHTTNTIELPERHI